MSPAPPRDRLLEAAGRLFAARGVQAVGIDAVIAEAGVAKASLYAHFRGKADLIAAVLDDDAAALALYSGALDRGGHQPAARIGALFDALDDLVGAPDWRGCRWATTGVALAAEPDHPAHDRVRRHKSGVRQLLLHEAAAAGTPDPDMAADQLTVLVEGVLVSGVLRPGSHPAAAVRPLAVAILSG